MNIERIKTILKGMYTSIGKDYLTIVSAGMAYYFSLGIFPILAAIVLIYGLVSEPAEAQNQINNLGGFIPSDIKDIVANQIGEISEQENKAGVGLAISLLLAIWSGSKASRALIQALNIVYDERESRGFVKVTIIGLGLSILGIFTGLIITSLIVVVPPVLKALHVPSGMTWLIQGTRWSLLVLLFMTVLALLYRFAPDRKPVRWKWVTPGALFATLFWILGSLAFSWYVSNFGNYNETYGSLGAAVIFLLWLYISAFLVLLGAELNQKMEQTGLELADKNAEPAG